MAGDKSKHFILWFNEIGMVKDNLSESKPVPTESIHKQAPDIYRKNILYPLFRILTSEQLLAELRQQGA